MSAATQATSDTANLIAETARRIFSAHCTAENLKAAEGGWSPSLWQALDDAGITGALEPEGKGVLDIPVPDAMNLLRIAGEFSAPVPLAEHLIAHWLALSAGLPLLAGPTSIAPVNAADRLAVVRNQDHWRITGQARRVPFGRHAKALVVAVENDGGAYLALVPAAAFIKVVTGENMAREPRDNVTIDATLGDNAVKPFAPGFNYVQALGAAARVMQMAGALDGVLRLTVEYAQNRQQFGRPISKFQAVQQNVSIIGANVAAASAAANSAAQLIASNGSTLGIGAAKLRSNEAASVASKIAHQVHGAMGFTQDYSLHFLTRRLWSWRDEFGNDNAWGRALGDEVFSRGAGELWAFITSGMN